MFNLEVLILLMTVNLHLCQSEALLPQDAVTLTRLKVDDRGMVGLEIVIEDIYQTLNKTDLEVVLMYYDFFTDRDVTVIHLADATSNGTVISSTIQGLKQDIKYFLRLQANECIISYNYTLVTTGLQSITANADTNEITCHFLPNSRADGCQLEWRPMNLIGEEAGYIMLPRDQSKDKASIHLQSLIPGTLYQVYGYGLQEGDKLHTFPITLEGGLQPTGTPRASDMITEPRNTIDTMILVTTLSVVLAGIVVTIFVLICIIVGIVKCSKRSHTKMPKDAEHGEDIQTSTNICYGDILEKSQTSTKSDVKRDSLHLYDDIVALAPPSTPNVYENVDATTGLPTIPKPVNTEKDDNPPNCERACLPLKGITPLVSSKNLRRQQNGSRIKKGQSALGRAHTFQHLKLPKVQGKFATLSVVLEAADYETPIQL